MTAIALYVAELLLKLGLSARILLRRNQRPEANLAWIAVVFAIPIVGLFFYLLIGERHVGRLRLRRYKRARQSMLNRPVAAPADATDECDPELVDLVGALGARPMQSGNRLEFISTTERFIERLLDDIDAAQQHCHLVFYIYLEDDAGRAVAEALIRAVERGVACRLLLDSIGSRDMLRSELRSEMEMRGVQVIECLPARFFRMLFKRMDLRNHRKLVVIDGQIAYTGSQNLANASFALKPKFAPWIDVMLRVDGPSARDAQTVFLTDFYSETGDDLSNVLTLIPNAYADGVPLQILATGPESDANELQQMNQAFAHHAQEQLTLTTPYFVPDTADAAAIRTAARRGVRVRVIMPRVCDSVLASLAARSHVQALIDAGVEVYLFDGGMLHAKTFTIDGHLAVITTANFDRRSFDLNFECTAVVHDDAFCSEVIAVQDSYTASSKIVELGRWSARPWYKRLVENAAGLMSPLL